MGSRRIFSTQQAFDKISGHMKNTGGAVLGALDATSNYLQQSYEPMALAGQTVPIHFTDK